MGPEIRSKFKKCLAVYYWMNVKEKKNIKINFSDFLLDFLTFFIVLNIIFYNIKMSTIFGG